MDPRLTARIEAYNMAHKYANELYPKLAAIFAPLIGQKVVKADGTLLAKIAKLMPEVPCTPALHVYKYTSDYSLVWIVKTCVVEPKDGHGIAHYAEASVYVAHLKGDTVEKMYDAPNFRDDYNAEEVEAKRAIYRDARKAAADAMSALHPFGEYDR